jgi:hypothetical protein
LIGNHLNGNLGSSTFRFILAALLMDALERRPFLRGTKVALDATDNARLSAWQREQLLLTWHARERPWEIEGEAIARLGPPLNTAGNTAHGFYSRVPGARAARGRRAAERGLMPAHRKADSDAPHGRGQCPGRVPVGSRRVL